MVLVIKPSIERNARWEYQVNLLAYVVHSTVFPHHNYRVTGWKPWDDVQEWIHEQDFAITVFTDYDHHWFFENQNDFLITKMMFPEFNYHLPAEQPTRFKQFYEVWHAENAHKLPKFIKTG